jgi:hypothetical protein
MSEAKTVGVGPDEVTCEELAVLCKSHGKRVGLLVALGPGSRTQLVTYGDRAADKVEAHQMKEWFKRESLDGPPPPVTHHESFILDAAKVKEQRDDLLAAVVDLLGLYETPRDTIGGVESLVLTRVRAALAKATADPLPPEQPRETNPNGEGS